MAVHPAPVPPRRSGGIRRIALFARFPRWLRRLSGRPADDLTLLVDDDGTFLDVARAGALYPALADRIVELQAVLVPLFRECDAEAAVEQNRYRRQQVTLIVGGFLTATLGAVQAAIGKHAWPGILVSAVAAATTAFASVGRQSGALDSYLGNRLRAERLRSVYFNFLAHEPATDITERRCQLVDDVTAIRYGAVT